MFRLTNGRRLGYSDIGTSGAPVAVYLHGNPGSRTEILRPEYLDVLEHAYVICERDNAIPPAAQEHMSAHAGSVSRLDAGHSPFLSRPHDVTAIIQETLAVVVAEAGA